MIFLILFLRSDLHGKVTNRSCWHWINMQEAIVQVILESLKHSVWLSLSSIVHITCPLFVITLLSRFSRKTVSCSFLRTRTAWSSRARLSRANDGITSSCSPNLFRGHARYIMIREKFERFHLRFVAISNELLRIRNHDFILSVVTRRIIHLFFSLPLRYPLQPWGGRRKQRASERA